MTKLSNTKQLRITLTCTTAVAGLFAKFHNPEIVGKDFKWENFPDMCKEQSYVWLLISNLITDKESTENKEAEELAAACTFKFATSLCEKAGYV